jgi:hypothetical protein
MFTAVKASGQIDALDGPLGKAAVSRSRFTEFHPPEVPVLLVCTFCLA